MNSFCEKKYLFDKKKWLKNKPEIKAQKSTEFSQLHVRKPPPKLVWLERSQNFTHIDNVN